MKHLHVTIYGPLCATCNLLFRRVIEVLEAMKVSYDIEKVEDPDVILAHGYLITPVLVINQQVISQGEIPFFDRLQKDIEEILRKESSI